MRRNPNPKKSPSEKSRLIQFRLNPEIAGEGEAIRILDAWEEQGYPRRQVMTWALHALAEQPLPPTDEAGSGLLRELLDYLRQIDLSRLVYRADEPGDKAGKAVDKKFVRNIAAILQPGVVDEDDE